MAFELDNILVNQILFHMENQEGIFVIDTRKNQAELTRIFSARKADEKEKYEYSKNARQYCG